MFGLDPSPGDHLGGVQARVGLDLREFLREIRPMKIILHMNSSDRADVPHPEPRTSGVTEAWE